MRTIHSVTNNRASFSFCAGRARLLPSQFGIKNFILRSFLAAILLAPLLAAAQTPTNAPAEAPPPPVASTASPADASPLPAVVSAPRVLSLELTVLRFKPATNQPFYTDYKLSGPISSVVATLLASGRSVDVLYHGTRELILESKSSAKFSATETRPVVLIGKQGTSPPAIVYGLTMDISARPVGRDAFALAWDGSLNWSPDLIDRRVSTGPDAAQILAKAATAAKSMGAFAGNSQAASIGLAVADLFKEDTANNSAIYELPVLKTVAMGGSRVCHGGEAIVSSTAAEAGANQPQIIFLIINPVVE